ncbi:MAG: DUF169 domain-containing protein, partial [Methanoregulaceae archaeon]|nr:DUF169 domain-containing protein [Methanoregulaceae archaeon]
MDMVLRDKFSLFWEKYFPGSGLPITFEIGGNRENTEVAPVPKNWRCLVCDLSKVRRGTSLVFDESTVGCSGGKIYTGLDTSRRPEFRYFISSG